MEYNNFSFFHPIELLLAAIVVFFATIATITRICLHNVAQNTTLFGSVKPFFIIVYGFQNCPKGKFNPDNLIAGHPSALGAVASVKS
ncbi:hypothetical protein [Paenibacillus sp. Soil724D2]|uniref:hypothetical protein n=1 Tax=Paenibacillus sp. (strain Soil724D2) TaxID=1736392 RepID=UPI000712780D|nr:hypothetical protein [Paenibacillus sp. Soil724D2]KRE47264.1 hypothetical protein ASG85_27750 [Paenibacillus sp. Soil724D2]